MKSCLNTVAASWLGFCVCLTLAICLVEIPACQANSQSNEKNLQKLLKQLHDADKRIRDSAARSLADFPTLNNHADQAVPILLDALKYTDNIGVGTHRKDGGDSLRQLVAGALKNAGPKGVRALKEKGIDMLLKNLDKETPGSQYHTVVLFGQLGTAAEKAIPQVVKMSKSKNGSIRREAFDSLAEIGPKATPILVDMATKGDDETKYYVLYAYRWSERIPDAMIPIAVDLLEHSEPDIRYQAATVIKTAGPAAKAAIPALLKLLGDKQIEAGLPVRKYVVAKTLAKIGGPAVRGLIRSLKDPNVMVRINGMYALQEIGPAGSAAIPALEELAKSTNAGDRGAAIKALASIKRKTNGN